MNKFSFFLNFQKKMIMLRKKIKIFLSIPFFFSNIFHFFSIILRKLSETLFFSSHFPKLSSKTILTFNPFSLLNKIHFLSNPIHPIKKTCLFIPINMKKFIKEFEIERKVPKQFNYISLQQ